VYYNYDTVSSFISNNVEITTENIYPDEELDEGFRLTDEGKKVRDRALGVISKTKDAFVEGATEAYDETKEDYRRVYNSNLDTWDHI
jgi:hypothetical protein